MHRKLIATFSLATITMTGAAFAQTPSSPSTPSSPGSSMPQSKRPADDGMKSQQPTDDAMKPQQDRPMGQPGRDASQPARDMAREGSQDVKAIQEALQKNGYDPGPADGRMGSKTRTALKDYQKSQGLKDTGRPDSETLAKLGVESKTRQQ